MNEPSELLDRVRDVAESKYYSRLSIKSYTKWVELFLQYSNKQIDLLDDNDIRLFLEHLTVDRKVSSATKRQVLTAMIFLFEQVLNLDVKHVRAYKL